MTACCPAKPMLPSLSSPRSRGQAPPASVVDAVAFGIDPARVCDADHEV